MQDHLKTMADELAAGQAQLLDVRELPEWEAGHLTQAKLVPLSELSEEKIDEAINKSLKTYIHCRSGNRVMQAAPILDDMGFEEVIALQEGFDDLVSEGFEEA